MASLDKTSVRSQIEKIKSDFEHFCMDGKIAPEMQAIMNSLLMIAEFIFAILIERTAKKNSGNSSIPPLQTDKDNSSLSDLAQLACTYERRTKIDIVFEKMLTKNIGTGNTGDASHSRQASLKRWQNGQVRHP